MPKEPTYIYRYGLKWNDRVSGMDIEREMVRHGGVWEVPEGSVFDDKGNVVPGKTVGLGLWRHYRNLFVLLWPEDDNHRWSDQMLFLFIKNRITVVQGARDSGKTRCAAKFVLAHYWCFPHDSLTVMTSTDTRGLELRIWGDIKSLFERARKRYRWLEGNVVDARYGLFTDNIKEDAESRDLRKGIIGVPIISSQGEFLGQALKNFAGIKQKRRILLGDELQYIPLEYLSVLDAMDKGHFKGIFLGNPIGGNGKALDRIAEPIGGWDTLGELKKTVVWNNKYNGVTLNLVGIDSPNFDPATKNRFSYLIDESDVNRVSNRPGGKDSIEWWSLIMGVRKFGVFSNRILTIQQIEENGGFLDCKWSESPSLRIIGIDAGFGGGDPCILTSIECGVEVGGQNVIRFGEQVIIPIVVSRNPDTQIAEFTKKMCSQLGVPHENVFVEAGMHATLMIEMAQVLSPSINAVNFGGTPTDRPVSNDVFIFDENTKQRRLKTCKEHYIKFVTELWFTVTQVVLSKQSRNFPREAAQEFQNRNSTFEYGDRYEIEPKADYKKRYNGESPNHADSLVVAVEGARRLGFIIERMKDGSESAPQQDDWLETEVEQHKNKQQKRELNYSA